MNKRDMLKQAYVGLVFKHLKDELESIQEMDDHEIDYSLRFIKELSKIEEKGEKR